MKRRSRTLTQRTISKVDRGRLARVERLLRQAMELLADVDPPARTRKPRKRR